MTFTPTRPGARYGAATLSSAGATIATGYVYGTGVGSQVAFQPGIASLIGSNFGRPAGAAVDSLGDVFVADSSNNAIKEIVAVGGAVSSTSTIIQIATGFTFNYPTGVAVDGAGNVFVADNGNNAVEEIVAVNGVVSATSTVNPLATGASFYFPYSVAVDGAGNVYVADEANNSVREIMAVDGVVSATSAVNTIGSGFSEPQGVAVDSAGDVFVADTGHSVVTEVVASGGSVSASSPLVNVGSGFAYPYAVAVDAAGNVFVASTYQSIVDEIVAVGGTVSSSSNVIPIATGFVVPSGLAVDGRGDVFIADSFGPTVTELDFADPPALSFASTAVGSTSSDSPQTVTITNNGNAPLTFEVPTAGLNPSISAAFTFGGASTCPQLTTNSSAATLAPGASCSDIISFTPTVVGSITGSLVTTDNALNANGPSYVTQSIALSGTSTPLPLTATTAVASRVLTQGIAATAFTPVTGTGGTGMLTYSISPALPAGLILSSSTGAVSGTPTVPTPATAYTVTVTDTTSATATATFNLTVNPTPVASTVALSLSSGSITAGSPVTLIATVTPNPGSGGPPAVGLVVFQFQQTVNGGVQTGSFGPIALNLAGTASFKFYPGVGTYTVTATFNGITGEATSVSPPQTLAVSATPLYASVTTLTPATISPGDYTLASTVAAFGQVAPSGQISFYSDSTTLLGTAALDPATIRHSLATAAGSPIFFPPQGSNGPDQVTYVVSGDVNGDGIRDLVTGHTNDATYIAVQLGVGDGTFGAPTQLTTTYAPNSIAIADVNGDGFPDLVDTEAGTGLVYVFFGNGNGTFGAETVATGSQGNGSFVVVTDLNGDGIPDLAIAYTYGVLTALGNGDGTFGISNFNYGQGGIGTEGVAVADFNHDGIPDMIMSNQGQGTLTLFLGVGDGTFQTPTSISLPDMNPTLLTATDLRHNGTQDLIVTDSVDASVYVLLGNNDGTFQTAVGYPIGAAGANQALAADVTNDGIPDLVVAGYGSSGAGSLISILPGVGDGTFGTKVDYATGAGPLSLTLADFNGDGLLDIATADEFAPGDTVYLQNQSVSASITNIVLTGAGNHNVTANYPGDASRNSSQSAISVLASVLTASTAMPSTVLTQNHAATALTPVAASGGTPPLTYSVAPALPAGLAFSSTTGAVSGTPTAVSAAATYTVTVTDANGATATATFSLTVNTAVIATTAAASTTLTQNHAAAAFTPVTASGGAGALTYSVAPALPAGLAFSSTTGAVSGTPTAVSAAATYTVTVTDANGATATATFSLTVSNATPTATITTVTSSTLTPTYGATVVLTATVTPAPVDNPLGTVSFYTGTTLLGSSALNSTGVATITTTLLLGSNSITAVYSGSVNYAGSTSSSLSVSNRTGSTVTFSASPTTQLYNNPIVLTAQVTSGTPGTFTGTVNFRDGTTVIATATVGTNGQATTSIATLSDGSHNLTAAYSGDANFQPSASAGAAISITVADVNLNLGNDQNQSVVPGGAVAYTFPLSPLVTPTFIYNVSLTATGLPPGATYTFSPAMIPAGSGSLPVTLNIQTAKGTARLSFPKVPGQPNSARGLTTLAFGLLLPLFGAKPVRRRLKALPKPLAILLLSVLGLAAATGLSGCGSSGFFGPTPTSGNYTITVTATSADLVRVSTVKLTIE